MHDVNAGRALMGDSLGFHIIFALLGVGLPLVILLIEHLGLRRKDALILEHAKRLSQASVILVIAGVASGTIISIQFSLVWGKLIEFGGPVLGLAFGWEGYAFMLESVFLAFYIASWGKIKGWKHFLIGVPAALGALGSALSITLGNAWMQMPGNPLIINGKVVSYNPLHDLLTKTALFMTTHSVIGYYLATILCVLGVYAFYYFKFRPSGNESVAVKQIMFRLAATSLVFVIVTAVIGHLQTQYLATSQPRKFAALETVSETRDHAPYIIAGELQADGSEKGGLKIPNGLSFLTGNSPNTTVPGIKDFPKTDWPLFIINSLFEIKLVFVALITIIPLAFVVFHSRKFGAKLRRWRYKKISLITLMLSGPLAIVVVELGWVMAEFGRQPFAVNGYLRTEDAFSASGKITQLGYIFPSLYLILFASTGLGLWLLFKRKGKLKPSKGLL